MADPGMGQIFTQGSPVVRRHRLLRERNGQADLDLRPIQPDRAAGKEDPAFAGLDLQAHSAGPRILTGRQSVQYNPEPPVCVGCGTAQGYRFIGILG